jgi:uncharacterized protein (DUF2235 family)
VLKLLSVLENDPARQIAYYHPGLGTMEAAAALTSVARKVTKLLGLAIGYGLERDVRDAYAFLMQHFQAGDTLFLFGFSRGAYTVRAVASVLHMYGLLPAGNEPLVPYAIRMLSAVNRSKQPNEAFALAAQFRTTFRGPVCKPHFVGVWDTVSSVGWIENPLRLPYSASNPDIAIGRHAVALDERRAFFRTNLWRPDPGPPAGGPKDLKQVWFPGVHSDVGGGYPEAESGLSKHALEWMVREAAAAGLLIDRARLDEVMGRSGTTYAKADPDAKMHESLTGAWRLAEFVPKRHWNWQEKREERRMNLSRRRTVPAGALVHEVAFRRSGYAPPAGAVMETTQPW